MTSAKLRGPLRLETAVIANFVPADKAGVYVLGAIGPGGLQSIDGVGRADRDLADTLIGLVGSNSSFMFATASSPSEAFEMECLLYHENMLTGRSPHPVAPTDSGVRCAVCGLSG